MGFGFEGLKAMLDRNKQQKSIEEDELEKDQCPYCFWKLKINEDTGERTCPICEILLRNK